MKKPVSFPEHLTEEEKAILTPLISVPPGFWLGVGFFAMLLFAGIYAYLYQWRYGLGMTGLNRPIFWGVYITNFVFFIGISHAGTLISSVLRITNTEWRRPFTRAAEAITIFSLPFGALCIILDLGRPDRVLNVLRTPHFTSPLIWDVICISTYLLTSTVYFYLALLPDLALCRDYLPEVSPFRRALYRRLALGYVHNPARWKKIERIMLGMCIFLFILVVSVHTNVSFVFLMTIQPGWHTTVLAPYFVLGAVYSGTATVIIIMAILRKVYHLEHLVTPAHFQKVGKFLLALALFWLYFTGIEFISIVYGQEISHMAVLRAKFFEEFAHSFWAMVFFTFLLPLPFLVFGKLRTIPGLVFASLSINIGMWLERYTVIVPSEARPRLPYMWGIYIPSWVEIFITIGLFAGFSLLYWIFSKFFPVLTIWEIREGKERAVAEFAEEVKSYYPEMVVEEK
ncbi:MAG: NrfD/PsrC family molybdoenzyme membrane anchor subunit [bacterium]